MAGERMLECRGLRRRFGELVAVDGVGFHIDPGETYGLLGPNGAGKTTTISMIAGLLERDDGEVMVAGEPMTTHAIRAKSAIGYVPQDLAIYPDLSARLHAGLVYLDDLPDRPQGPGGRVVPPVGGSGGTGPPRPGVTGGSSPGENTVALQRTHGYTEEELRVILAPMARTGAEPIGSMGTDTPVAVLSDRPRLIFDYFTQLFAQVTNPPLDAIREELVTSLGTITGPEQNLLEPVPALPPDRAAVPGDQRQRSGQDRAYQRRREPARVRLPRGGRPLRPARRRRGPARPAHRDLRRGLGRDRGLAPG